MQTSAWSYVRDHQDDMAWLETVALTRSAFALLLKEFAPALRHFWVRSPSVLPGSKTRIKGRPRAMTPCDVLGLVLNYLHTTSSCATLCQIFAVPPAVQNRALVDGLHVLVLVLEAMPLAAIKWPTKAQMQYYASRVHAAQPSLIGVFAVRPECVMLWLANERGQDACLGTLFMFVTHTYMSYTRLQFVDGLNLSIHKPSDPEEQNVSTVSARDFFTAKRGGVRV